MVQSSASDIGSPEKSVFTTTPEQLGRMVDVLEQNQFPLDRLKPLTDMASDRRDLVDKFKQLTGTNGNADRVMEELALYIRESNRQTDFLQKAKSPEKKGLFRRSWDGIKNLMKKHPYITAGLILALAAAGVAAGFYYAGQWELLMTTLGLKKIEGVATAIGEMAPVTPVTPPLPGGGFYDVPGALPAPGEFPHITL